MTRASGGFPHRRGARRWRTSSEGHRCARAGARRLPGVLSTSTTSPALTKRRTFTTSAERSMSRRSRPAILRDAAPCLSLCRRMARPVGKSLRQEDHRDNGSDDESDDGDGASGHGQEHTPDHGRQGLYSGTTLMASSNLWGLAPLRSARRLVVSDLAAGLGEETGQRQLGFLRPSQRPVSASHWPPMALMRSMMAWSVIGSHDRGGPDGVARLWPGRPRGACRSVRESTR